LAQRLEISRWNIGAEGQMLMGALAAEIVGYAVHAPTVSAHSALRRLRLSGASDLGEPSFASSGLYWRQRACCVPYDESDCAAPHRPGRRPRASGAGTDQQIARHSRFGDSAELLPVLSTERGISIALGCCAIVAVINQATLRGFEWMVIGLNQRFAHYGGVDVCGNALVAFLLSGGIARLAGAEPVLAAYKAYYDNFLPGYGFDGIAVAMLARNNPVGVILAAFLLGALNAGSGVLQMMTGLSKNLI
jgi:general nucleoside transport system permease protein